MPRLSTKSFSPYVGMRVPFAANNCIVAGRVHLPAYFLGNNDMSAPVSIKNLIPEFLSVTWSLRSVVLPSAAAPQGDGLTSFPAWLEEILTHKVEGIATPFHRICGGNNKFFFLSVDFDRSLFRNLFRSLD